MYMTQKEKLISDKERCKQVTHNLLSKESLVKLGKSEKLTEKQMSKLSLYGVLDEINEHMTTKCMACPYREPENTEGVLLPPYEASTMCIKVCELGKHLQKLGAVYEKRTKENRNKSTKERLEKQKEYQEKLRQSQLIQIRQQQQVKLNEIKVEKEEKERLFEQAKKLHASEYLIKLNNTDTH